MDRPPPPTTPTASDPASRYAMRTTIGVLLFAVVLLSSLAIFNPTFLIRSASAEQLYHIPAIERFASQLPAPDYSDYSSATSPGYHTVLAIPRSMGISYQGIRLIASIWTLLIVGILTWALAKKHRLLAAAMITPVLSTSYILFPGIWLLPDNSAWLGILLITILALRENPTWKTHALSSVILFALIYFRQVNIWAAAPIWVAAWIGSTDQTPPIKQLLSNPAKRFPRTLLAVLFTLPAFLLLLYFINLWGGLVTPTFQEEHQGPNPATPAFILLQISILSVFFLPMLLPRLNQIRKNHTPLIITASVLSALIAIIPESSYNQEAGRYSGIWNLIHKLPLIQDRSPIFIIGAIAGTIFLVAWGSILSRRDRWIFGAVLISFTAAQTANHASWQRYHEPMLLIILMLTFARSTIIEQYPKRAAAGSLALATMLASITLFLMQNQVPRDISDPRVEALTEQQNPRTTPDTPRTTP